MKFRRWKIEKSEFVVWKFSIMLTNNKSKYTMHMCEWSSNIDNRRKQPPPPTFTSLSLLYICHVLGIKILHTNTENVPWGDVKWREKHFRWGFRTFLLPSFSFTCIHAVHAVLRAVGVQIKLWLSDSVYSHTFTVCENCIFAHNINPPSCWRNLNFLPSNFHLFLNVCVLIC